MKGLKLVKVKNTLSKEKIKKSGQKTSVSSNSFSLTYIHYLDLSIKDLQPNFTKLVELTAFTKLLHGEFLPKL